VQRRGLLDGAQLADRLSDFEAAKWYRQQARELEPEIARHWDAGRGYITVTLNRDGGLDYKSSGLDSAVVLAALHASPRNGNSDSFFGVTDDRVLATAGRIAMAFRQSYSVNSRDRNWDGQAMGPGIGRYPEDRYSGTSSSQGNPWFLATNAFAELYYRCAHVWEAQGHLKVTAVRARLFTKLGIFNSMSTQALLPGEVLDNSDPRFQLAIDGLRETADSYLRRSQFHTDNHGAMSEQFNRDSGYMQSAAELTWSHASIITAAWEHGK
jgi:glucoamylase